MKNRDCIRTKICRSSNTEKAVLMKKYKILRNLVTNLIRKENLEFNNKRFAEGNNEGELWKIANEVTNQKKQSKWKLDINSKKVENEQEIADCFNGYFADK